MFDRYEILEQLDTPFDTLNKLLCNTKHNDYISDLYMQLYEETDSIEHKVNSERVKDCFSKIFLTRYERSKVVDMNSINTCKNKFCQNCLKLLQASRLSKMDKVLESNKLEHDLYHIVLTIPNCLGKDLIYTLEIMSEAFSKLIRYFCGNAKLKGLDFKQFEYFAAMRSLEITYNERCKDYHPHLHCIFSLKKGLELNKTIKNKFSWSYDYNLVTNKINRNFKRYFCDFEITLQKLWRKILDNIIERDNLAQIEQKQRLQIEEYYNIKALTNKQIGELGISELANYNCGAKPKKKIQAKKITLVILNAMSKDDGYSVIVDKVDENNYYEVFKYAFKLFDDDKKIIQYEQFVIFLKAMYKRKQVQCYGGWYDIDVGDNIDMESVSAIYYLIIQELEKDKEQIICCSTLQEIVELKKQGYAVISKKQIFAYLSAMDTNTLAQARNDIAYVVEDLKRQNELKKIETYTQRYCSVSTRYQAPNFKDKTILSKLKERRQSFAIQCEYDLKMDKEYNEQKDFESKSLSDQMDFINSIF